jgi:methionyl-tRNA formyltransferase
LDGYELYDDLRKIQAETTIAICWEFLENYSDIIPKEQVGSESFYDKRSASDSVLDINKTISEQFNLLRTVNNEAFPAFFEIDGHRYILKIEHDEREMNR